ncbi:MAG TPA: winged helix-turn-helix transcriptional regulator [Candidatus Acidoferrum sp.]|nr:winged helix-turn-helix transcriptional regulator [Candidatus Acidoferrum sp.]
MKNVELRLMAELMKNSRRSDRELARVLGVSQPTISRTIAKLKRNGYIREFTIIPDYEKLGYQLAAFTLVKMKSGLSMEELQKAREVSLRDMRQAPSEIVLFERGLDEGYSGILVSFHKDYSSYYKLKERMKHYPFLDLAATTSFIIDLTDKVHYRYLTFSTLASNVLEIEEKRKQPARRLSHTARPIVS